MAKIPTPNPEDLTWREIHRLELITPAMGGTTTFDGNDDPTAGHMNAQAIQFLDRTEMLRHRNPASERNAILSARLDGSGNVDFIDYGGAVDEVDVFADANDPLILTFASGFGKIGAVDYIACVEDSTTLDVSALADGVYPIMATFDRSDGSVLVHIAAYAYASGFLVSVTAPSIVGPLNAPGRYWWNPRTYKAYRTEGSPGSVAWVQTWAVNLGVVEVTGGTVDSFTAHDLGTTQDPKVEVPAGAVTAYAGNGTPAGWFVCDGSAISRTGFPKLFTAIGTTWGVGDGSTTFNIPDLRGEFIRGFDAGRGIDTGRAYASLQADSFEDHTHTVPVLNSGTAAAGDYIASAATTNDTVTSSVASTGAGTETRPRNVAMYYVIKSN